ncbi:hypothetical protein [Sphingomonas phage Carli]|nr:hypothetical protein [Sphingomonas phage Carli]
MAGEERDARLILRAEDRASKTFDQVAASIKRVRQEIADQSKAVQAGTGDITGYQRALDELKSAGDDLVKGQSLIRQFEGQSESVKKAEDRLRSATEALAAYQAKVGQTPTGNQSTQIDKRSAAIDRAQANLERANSRLADIEGRMQRAGIATDNLETQFDQMAAAAVEAAQGIAAAKNAIDDYPKAVQRATDAAEEFAAAQKLGGKDQSFLAPNEFAFIQSLDSAKAKLAELAQFEQLEARSAATAAAAETQRRQQQRVAIDDVYESSKRLEAQFATLNAEQQRLDDVNAFRQIGIDAAESAVKVERYAASVQSLGNDFQSFSQQVRASLGGTQSSLQDIGQAIKQVDTSTELLGSGTKKINDLSASAGQLAIAIATLDRAARQIDGFRAIQMQVQQAEATFAEAQAEVLRLARAVGEADAPVEALERELEQAQRALNRAGNEMQRVRNEAIKMGDGLRKAGIDADNLEAEMLRIGNGAQKAGTAAGALSGKLRGKGGFLGLNAFEMQNLGYQVNDVFTQLGSGTSVFQILAQQGPQIIQLFQGLGSSLLRLSPLIAGVLVLLSPFIGAIMQAAQATDALRTANTLLAGTGGAGGGAAAAADYAEASIQLQNLGNSAKDATAILTTFRDSGLDPAALGAFTNALDLAGKGGADLTETAKLLADAMSGGAKEVEALNDKFNILTPSEEAQIEKMLESGQESEARRIIFEKFETTAQRMADSARGPWSKSWDDLKFAFNNFTRAIADSTPFRALNNYLNSVGRNIRSTIDDLTYFFNYASKRGVFGAIGDAIFGPGGPNGAPTQAQAEAAGFANRRGRREDNPFDAGGGAGTKETREGARAVRDATEALEEQRKGLKKLGREETAALARRKALRSAVGSPEERKQQGDLAAQTALLKYDDDAAKSAERAGKKRESAAKRAARAAETLANQRRAIEEQLVRDLDGLEAKADKTQLASLEDRLSAVDKAYTATFQKIEAFKAKGGTNVDGVPIAQYEAQVRAQIQILRNQEQMKFYEESINAAIKDRTDQIKAVQDALDRGDISSVDATKQVEEIVSRFAPQISKLSADAIAFAKSLRGATPDPKLEAFISRFERVTQQNSAGQDRSIAKQFAQSAIEEESRKLQEIISQRDQLVAAENTLVELGVKTRTDAQSAIEAAYARTTPLVQQQSAILAGLLDQFVKAYPEMATFYDAWKAKLAAVGAQSQYVSAQFTQLKSGIDGLLTQNIVAGIDAIAQSFARLALGQQNAVDTLLQVGAAFLGFIADTIIGLAKLILQMVILSAVEKATGIPVGALLKFMNATGLHTGGIAGQERTFSRRVPEAAFVGAPRYHGGGVAGFAPDEVPAILKKNEEVLDESDPRHRFNLGAGGGDGGDGGPPVFRQALVLDPSELANAMAGPAGEKMVVTHIRRNKTTLKQIMDS